MFRATCQMNRHALHNIALSALVLTSCAATGSSLRRPIDEDLLSLLPAGIDAVIDIDVAQLSQWAPLERLRALLPPSAQHQLEELGVGSSIDAVVIGVHHWGEAEPATVLWRSHSDTLALHTVVGTAETHECDSVAVLDGEQRSVAKLGSHLYVLGSAAHVRQVIQVAHGHGQSFRDAKSDRELRQHMTRAPTAKIGRPAIMAAALVTPEIRKKLFSAGFPVEELDWVTLSLAVGDGFDLAGIGGTRSPTEAVKVAGAAKQTITTAASEHMAQMVGFAPLLSRLVFLAREADVKFALRVPEPVLDRFFARLENMARRSQ